MRKAGGILGLIGGIFAVVAALVTLFLGGVGGALGAHGANQVIGLGFLGLLAAFLAIIFGAVVLGTRSRVPGVLLLASAALGMAKGGMAVALCMALVLVGGILAVVGSKGATPVTGAGLAPAVSPPRRKGWRIAGMVAGGLVVLVGILIAIGGSSGSSPAKTPVASASSSGAAAAAAKAHPTDVVTPAPVPKPAPRIGIGQSFRTRRFQIEVNSVQLRSQVGGDFINDSAAQGAEYVAVAWTYENISNNPADAFSVPRVHLVDAHGTVYDPDIEASSVYATQIDATAKALSNANPGIALTDGAVFEVSQQLFDPRTWTILVKSGDQRVTVALSQAPASQPSAASQPAAPSVSAAPRPVAASAPATVSNPEISAKIAQGVETVVPGTIEVGHDKLAGGAYTYVQLDAPIASPCDGSPLRDVLLWNASIGDPLMLRSFAGRHVLLHGSFDCPMSGVQFAPDSATQP